MRGFQMWGEEAEASPEKEARMPQIKKQGFYLHDKTTALKSLKSSCWSS